MGYGDFTILIQSTGTISLATVIKGTNSEFLIEDMKRILNGIGDSFDDWAGDVSNTKDLKLTPAGIEEVKKNLLAPEKRATKKTAKPARRKKARAKKRGASTIKKKTTAAKRVSRKLSSR